MSVPKSSNRSAVYSPSMKSFYSLRDCWSFSTKKPFLNFVVTGNNVLFFSSSQNISHVGLQSAKILRIKCDICIE